MAAWVHTYSGTSGLRQLCCVSKTMPDPYIPFKEHWNSPFMRGVRQQMLAGETVDGCVQCNNDPNPGRLFYESFYSHLKEEALAKTAQDGTYSGLPVSVDYRLGNLCNFKCNMCGPEFSSAWMREYETFSHPYFPAFKEDMDRAKPVHEASAQELIDFVESRTLTDILWGGGEPLINPTHWKVMNRIVETDQARQVHVRYNTNLSVLAYKGQSLVTLLDQFPAFTMGISFDACGELGEYLRHGMDWQAFKANVEKIRPLCTTPSRKIHFEHRLTLQGILGLPEAVRFANEYEIHLYSKSVIHNLTPKNMPLVNPRSIPKRILDPLLLQIIEETRAADTKGFGTQAVQIALELLQSPRADESMGPELYAQALHKSLKEAEKTDLHRYKRKRFASFFHQHPEIFNFLNDVPTVSAKSLANLETAYV